MSRTGEKHRIGDMRSRSMFDMRQKDESNINAPHGDFQIPDLPLQSDRLASERQKQKIVIESYSTMA